MPSISGDMWDEEWPLLNRENGSNAVALSRRLILLRIRASDFDGLWLVLSVLNDVKIPNRWRKC